MTVRTAFWVLLFFALSASSAAQVKGTVVLPESYSPTGTMTTLGEMATVSSENASLAKRIAAVIAVQSPYPDEVTAEAISLRLIGNGIGGVQITGARRVRLLKGSLASLRKRVEEEATAYFQSLLPEALEVRLTFQRVPEMKLGPGASLRFARTSPYIHSGTQLLRITATKNGRSESAGFLQVGLRFWAKVPVAKTPLSPGLILQQRDWEYQVREITYPIHDYIHRPEELIGHQVVLPIQEGEVLRSRMIASPLAVKRGSTVTLVLKNGPVQISTEGRALADGRLGETVKTLNPSTRKILTCLVTAAGRVEVTLP